jgi:hypothetical protein
MAMNFQSQFLNKQKDKENKEKIIPVSFGTKGVGENINFNTNRDENESLSY